MKVIWLTSAEEHLEEIYDFVAQKNPRAAVDIYNTLIEEADKLTTFPQIASLEPSLEKEAKSYRSLVVNKTYKIIYRIDSEAKAIIVVSVWDCRQDPGKLKKKVAEDK